MKDTEFITATMRIRALERGLLGRDRLERMIDAKSEEEAVKVLTDSGYEELPSPVTPSALESVLAAERDKTYHTVAEISPDKTIVDVFRVRYDYHNAKVLIKSEAMGENADRLLIDAGRIPAKQLAEACKSLSFSSLGPIGEAIVSARELLARTGDPQRSDFLMDNACTQEMLDLAKASKSEFLTGWVRLYIDASNLRSVVRASRIGKGPDFLRLILSPGGNADISRISSLLQSGSELESVFSGALSGAAEMGTPAMRGEGSLTAFEKKCDDALLAYLSGARYIPFGEQPLAAYLGLRENELTAVRTIMAGRLAGVSPDAIRERLREAYV